MTTRNFNQQHSTKNSVSMETKEIIINKNFSKYGSCYVCCTMHARVQEQHVREVIEIGNREVEKVSQQVREKNLQKMEATYKNREEQLAQIMEKLQEHVS